MISVYAPRIVYHIPKPEADCRCHLLELGVDVSACPQHGWNQDEERDHDPSD